MQSEKTRGIMAKFGEWILRNREKIHNLIAARLQPGEELSQWAFCMAAPPEILDWLPLLDLIHRLNRRHFILAITNQRLLRIETKAMSLAEVKGEVSFPLEDITSIKATHGLFTSSLKVTTRDGKSTVYKEIEADVARTFEAEFESMRR